METKVCKCCGQEKPIDQFYKNAWGATSYCTDCHNKLSQEGRERKKKEKNLAKEIEVARRMRLEDFEPRELMKRLSNLGYEGTLTYTRVETIDISRL